MKYFQVEGWRGITYDKWWISEGKLLEIGEGREFEIIGELDVPSNWSPVLIEAALNHAEIELDNPAILKTPVAAVAGARR